MTSLGLIEVALLAILFIAIFAVGMIATMALMRSPIKRRLKAVIEAEPIGPKARSADGLAKTSKDDAGRADTPEARWLKSIAKLAHPLANLSLPDAGWEESELRLRFMQAGIRSPQATPIFFAIKTLLAAIIPIAFGIVKLAALPKLQPNQTLIFMALLSGVGYYLPNLFIKSRGTARKKLIQNAFPDALDLLTICVEAGLSLDAGIDRVAQDLGLSSPELSIELALVGLELRAGSSREHALRNLALRTGVEDVESLVAMLIQSDKFGTGIADALRVHSELLRVKRQQRAEETAAKLPAKLLLPMMLCIFPAIMVVVAGPAMIQIGKVMAKMGGK
jgi:tight adherence protein C